MNQPSKFYRVVTSLLFSTALLVAPVCAQEYPRAQWARATPADVGMDVAQLNQAVAYAQSSDRDPGSGYITRHGKLVAAWGDLKKTYDLKSSSKSIGVTALGLALDDGKLTLDDRVVTHLPAIGTPPDSNASTGWLDEITVRHLATQTAGFAKRGGYSELLFRPGTEWHYSDCGPNWLADCVTTLYGRDVQELMFERVFTPIGITRQDLRWRNNAYREHELNGVKRREFGSGVHANVDAMARLGLLYLRHGAWDGRQLIPAGFVDRARTTVRQVVDLPEHAIEKQDGQWTGDYGDASAHYGLLWWNNADGTIENAPRDAYWSWGLYDSFIVVIPSLDVVVARAGKSWEREPNGEHYDVLKPFIEPIVASIRNGGGTAQRDQPAAPYPPSDRITGVAWAPRESIVRLANGSDNWPITWADDGHLYTAYGDGWGFEPRVEKKLSLGLARIEGDPPHVTGVNIRSTSGEKTGQGAHGLKAGGMLCVDGVLYMWMRNAGNAQLAWSTDHGLTWQNADWKFTTSFGCPTFLNFGQNYQGARDDYAYLYSADSDTAYDPADQFVLARVPKDLIREKDAYEFFRQLDNNNQPTWTNDIHQRGPVFTHPGRAYRGGVTYNAPLKRYLWTQILPESRDERGTRYEGGFGIYEAPQPWGPWSTVFFTNHWDVGPGETSSFPTKWISPDGTTLHLLFSGDDHFSIRQGKLTINRKTSP